MVNVVSRRLSTRPSRSQKSVTDCLRTAKLISAKLGLPDIGAWINSELRGYEQGENVPAYRGASGTLQVRNPYHGWIIVSGAGVDMPFGHSMPQLEDLARQETVFISPQTDIPISTGDESVDSMAMSLPQRVVFAGTVFKGMVEAVRDRLLDWSLELEKHGIMGEDTSFDESEKRAAHNQVFNIQNFTGVFGDVSHSNVNVYDYGSIHAELKQRNIPQSERNELESLLDELKSADKQQKTTLIEKGKAWIVRNQEWLGAGASIVRQALGIPDVA